MAETIKIRRASLGRYALAWLVLLAFSPNVTAEEGAVIEYRMDVVTHSTRTNMPKMPAGVPGMSGMPGNATDKPAKILSLHLASPPTSVKSPQATHDVSALMRMGKTLAIEAIPEEPPKTTPADAVPDDMPEMKSQRFVRYYGCGEAARKGQPLVFETKEADMARAREFMKNMPSDASGDKDPADGKKGWVYAQWPNAKSSVMSAPMDASLLGGHYVHGNYIPEMAFVVTRKYDFMAPVEFVALDGALSDAIKLEWKSIPTATGYFAQAVSFNQAKNEMIMWSSSEAAEMPQENLLDFLTGGQAKTLIKKNVVMPPDKTTCTIPKGIFKDSGGVTIMMTAYGDELSIASARQAGVKPKSPWNVKVRRMSRGTAMLMGGMPMGVGMDEADAMEDMDDGEDPGDAPEGGKQDGGTMKKLLTPWR